MPDSIGSLAGPPLLRLLPPASMPLPCLLEGTQLLLAGRIPQLVQRIVLDLLGGHSEMKVLAQ